MVLFSLYQPEDSDSIPLSLARTILTTHVLHRSLTLGTGVGLLLHPTLYPLFLRRTRLSATLPTSTITTRPKPHIHTTPAPTFKSYLLSSRIFPTIAKTTYVVTALVGLAMTKMMYGKSDIEWQDRAYRICWNEGQNRIDKGSVAGIVTGVVAGGLKGLKGHALVGAGGLGGFVGVLGAVGLGKLGLL